jgi:hypothetical protein
VITDNCQRWRAGRCRWRPSAEGFDPRAYEVAPIADDTTARAFVEAHHYAKSYPAARRRFGLYTRRGALVGVAVYSVPMHPAVLRPWRGDDATELGRLVLLDAVPGNAESWFVRRTFDVLAAEGFAGVVSYSDPVRRVALDGRVVLPGHVGTVYQALGAVYTGRGRSQTLRLLPDGSALSGRAVAKIRGGERGWRYAVEQLVAAGARAPAEGEDLRGWLAQALPTVARARKHPGNHRYLFGLTGAGKRALPVGQPYPRFVRPACSVVTATCERRAA